LGDVINGCVTLTLTCNAATGTPTGIATFSLQDDLMPIGSSIAGS